MIEVYLNLNGNAREAAEYYAKALSGEVTFLMTAGQMSEEERKGWPSSDENMVIHANVTTFAGQIMLADNYPGQEVSPSAAINICLSHTDLDKIRAAFDALAADGEVGMPLAPAFFSPLFGVVVDKYGFSWMMMSSDEPGA